MPKKVEIPIGSVFHRWTVTGQGEHRNGQVRWNVRCECGNTSQVTTSALRHGLSRSCGCLKREETGNRFRKHGMAGSPEYEIWQGMLKRCLNPSHVRYRDYGGRGVTVCDRWLDFKNFYADMGPRPEGLELDRKDNSRGYSKDNCRWATSKENNRNTRRNLIIMYQGVHMTLAEAAERSGIPPLALAKRYHKGDHDLFRPLNSKHWRKQNDEPQ